MPQETIEMAQKVADKIKQLSAEQLEKVLIFALGVEAGAKKEA